MKHLTSLILLVFILTSMVCFAAPETVSPYETANATDLIAITNPPGQKDSTFEGSYVISGYGKEGTVITVYWHDAGENVYKKLYNHVSATGGLEEATVTIGTSGLFMRTVDLSEGDHNLLVRAENNGNVQHLKISLTRYKKNIINIIKSWVN